MSIATLELSQKCIDELKLLLAKKNINLATLAAFLDVSLPTLYYNLNKQTMSTPTYFRLQCFIDFFKKIDHYEIEKLSPAELDTLKAEFYDYVSQQSIKNGA